MDLLDVLLSLSPLHNLPFHQEHSKTHQVHSLPSLIWVAMLTANGIKRNWCFEQINIVKPVKIRQVKYIYELHHSVKQIMVSGWWETPNPGEDRCSSLQDITVGRVQWSWNLQQLHCMNHHWSNHRDIFWLLKHDKKKATHFQMRFHFKHIPGPKREIKGVIIYTSPWSTYLFNLDGLHITRTCPLNTEKSYLAFIISLICNTFFYYEFLVSCTLASLQERHDKIQKIPCTIYLK